MPKARKNRNGPKRKLTAAHRRARRERKRKFMTIFIDGLTVDEFVACNADPIWLHQNELWEMMPDGDET